MTPPDQGSTRLAPPEVSRILGQTQPWARLLALVSLVLSGLATLVALMLGVAGGLHGG
jgi:hypothetical protein